MSYRAMAEPTTCWVVTEVLGIRVDACTDPATHEVTFTCDGGCVRQPRRVCEPHALLLSKDDPTAACAWCEEHIHPVGSRVLDERESRQS